MHGALATAAIAPLRRPSAGRDRAGCCRYETLYRSAERRWNGRRPTRLADNRVHITQRFSNEKLDNSGHRDLAGVVAQLLTRRMSIPISSTAFVGGSFGLDGLDDEAGEGIVFDTDGDGEYGDTVRTTTGANAFSPGFCNGIANGPRAADGRSDDKSRFGYGVRIGFDQRIGDGPIVAGLLVEGAMSDWKNIRTASAPLRRATPSSASSTSRSPAWPSGRFALQRPRSDLRHRRSRLCRYRP